MVGLTTKKRKRIALFYFRSILNKLTPYFTPYFSIYHSLKYLSILSILFIYLSNYLSYLSIYLSIYLYLYVIGPINPQQADTAEVWQTCQLLQRASNQLRSQVGAVHGPDLREGGGRALLQRRLRSDVSDPEQDRGSLGGGTKCRQIPHPTYFKVIHLFVLKMIT